MRSLLESNGVLVQYKENLDQPHSSKKSSLPLGLINILKNLPLKFLYKDVNEAKSMSPNS